MTIANVLLVDDDVDLLSSLAKVLEYNNFAVTIASNVSEALRRISTGQYDVLLSDLHMPGAAMG